MALDPPDLDKEDPVLMLKIIRKLPHWPKVLSTDGENWTSENIWSRSGEKN